MSIVSTIQAIVNYFSAIYDDCDPLNDWLTHILSPELRESIYQAGLALVQTLGC